MHRRLTARLWVRFLSRVCMSSLQVLRLSRNSMHIWLNGNSKFQLVITAWESNAGRLQSPWCQAPHGRPSEQSRQKKKKRRRNSRLCVKAAVLPYLVVIWEKQVVPPAAPAGATEQDKLERVPRLPSSKQHCGSRDPNTNSLITPMKLFVDISSQSHSSFKSLVRRQLNGPRGQEKK